MRGKRTFRVKVQRFFANQTVKDIGGWLIVLAIIIIYSAIPSIK